nr:pseudouridine synthase [Lachnospiraceae bacterium]
FPVGRLDKDTEGLLLITNDGKLAHDLLSPKKHVTKTYIALTDKMLDDSALEDIRKGVDIGEDKPCLPAEITYLGQVTVPEEPSGSGLNTASSEIPVSEQIASSAETPGSGMISATSEAPGQGLISASEGLYKYEIKISEGKYHQIKRMFSVNGTEVKYLKRTAFGALMLDETLKPGEYKKIGLNEIRG